jgi:hypothetical protein
MFAILYRSNCGHLVINSSYHTYVLFVLGSFFYNITYLPWLATSYNCTFFRLVSVHIQLIILISIGLGACVGMNKLQPTIFFTIPLQRFVL